MLAVVGTLAVASMIAGNLLGLFETRIKRLLAYSSIAHLGYAMLALLISGPAAVQAAAFYMTAYVVTVIAAFGVIAVLEPETGGAPTIEAYRGLLWRRPVLGTILMAAMFSLAGIPLTAGFVAKFLLLVAGVEAKLWIPVFALVLGSAIGVFYYLRVVVALFSRTTAEDLAHTARRPRCARHLPADACRTAHARPVRRGPAAPRPRLARDLARHLARAGAAADRVERPGGDVATGCSDDRRGSRLRLTAQRTARPEAPPHPPASAPAA